MKALPAALVGLVIVALGEAVTVFLVADAIVEAACAPLPTGALIGLTLYVVLSWAITTACLRRARRASVVAFAALGVHWLDGGILMIAIGMLGLARRGAALATGVEGYGVLFWVVPAGLLVWGVILIVVAAVASRQPLPSALTPASTTAPSSDWRRNVIAALIILVGLGVVGALTSGPTTATPPPAQVATICRG